jgi:hypothetical protein
MPCGDVDTFIFGYEFFERNLNAHAYYCGLFEVNDISGKPMVI